TLAFASLCACAGTSGPSGPKGEVGPAGPPGAIGSAGPQGDTGTVGPQGPPRAMGAAGMPGPAGVIGPTRAHGMPRLQGPARPAPSTAQFMDLASAQDVTGTKSYAAGTALFFMPEVKDGLAPIAFKKAVYAAPYTKIINVAVGAGKDFPAPSIWSENDWDW